MDLPRWIRYPAIFVLNAAIFAVLVWGGLRLTGRFLTVAHQGGDQSQTSPVDLGPVPIASSLPLVPDAEVRNVILIVADGMGFSHVVIGRSELGRMNEKLFFERFPVTGWQTTHGLESVYTDSASSASSLATGYKVPYRGLSQTPDGRVLTTVAEAARDRGLAVGAVTDTYLWDATPAAFFSHVASRRDFESINAQMASSGASLLIGELHGSMTGDDAERSGDLEAFLDPFEARGFVLVRAAADLANLSPRSTPPVLGLFSPGSIADRDQSPQLEDLARFALDKLSTGPNGFFLLVETEEADSGAHRRNVARIVRGVDSVNRVAALAVEHALADRETLVLITADHETGGLDVLHGDADHRLGVRWSTTSHSAEPVPIYAFGAGAERFSGVKDNTEIARTLAELLDLDLFR